MDSNLLNVFVTVANKKSISKAALKLKAAQSNITSKIQQLEKNLECKLFHRVPSGVVLTKEGDKLYSHAIEIVKKIEIASMDMKNMLVEQKLTIGSTEANANVMIVDFLVKLHKDFPNMELELITNTTEDIKRMLLEYKLDIGFVSGIPNEDEFIVLNKIDEMLVIAEPKQNEIPNVLISFKKGCSYSAFADKYFSEIQGEIIKKMGFASYETILGCIEAGIGKSILPLSIIKKLGYENKINILYLPKDIEYMPTCMICRKDNIPKIEKYLRNVDF
jgi:LysR family transcriptional regulator, cell division regulator